MIKILLAALATFVFGFASAQNYNVEANKVIPPSPTAAGLGKFGEFGTSGLATGTINVNVPIYTVNHHDINLPISLSYNGGGVKPSDIPGWVGLAWNLNAGGVITRIVNSIPDDCVAPKLGYYYGRSSLSSITSFPTTNMIAESIDGYRDFKPDKFIFNFNGESGKFFFDLEGNPVMEGQKKYKIDFDISYQSNHGVTQFFDVFYITTDDGTKYEFSAKEWTYYGVNGDLNAQNYYVSSWYLTKITSPLDNQITFTYDMPGNKLRYRESSFEKVVRGGISVGSMAFQLEQTEEVLSTTKYETIYLKGIEFGKGKVEFKTSLRNDLRYQPIYGTDVATENKLDSIVISYDNKVFKKFALGYIEPALGRLKLASVVEFDSQNEPLAPHTFEYNPIELPAFGLSSQNSFNSNSIDHWGFYNGKFNGVSRLPITKLNSEVFVGTAIRSVNPITAQAEILTRVTYPTGGYSKFTYESNDYSSISGSPVSGTDYDWSEVLQFIYNGNTFTAEGGEDPHLIQFVFPEESVIQVWGDAESTGPNNIWKNSITNSPTLRKLPAGVYTLAQIFGTDQLLEWQNSDINLAHGFLKYRYSKPVAKKLGGGLRISKIENFDGLDKLTEKRFEYKDLQNSSKSSGVLSKEPVYLRWLSDFWNDAIAFWFQSENLEATPDGPPILYANVREIFSDDSYVDHYYTTYNDYPDAEALTTLPTTNGINDYNSYAFLRGIEYETRTFAKDNNLVKKIETQFHEYSGLNKNTVSFDVRIAASFNVGTQTPFQQLLIVGKNILPSRFYVKSKEKITEYHQGVAAVVSEKDFSYSTNHLQLSTILEHKSDENLTKTYFKYPGDYIITSPNSSFAGLLYLQNRNVVNKVVEQYNEILTPANVSKGFANGIYNQFNSSGLISSVFSFKNEFPLMGFVPSYLSGNNLIHDVGAYVERLKIEKYGSKGNIIEQRKVGGVVSSYKWGYDERYPIMEAVNANEDEVYIQDFEEYTGATSGVAQSGEKFFSGNFVVNWTAPNSKSYKIDYWFLDNGLWKIKSEAFNSPSHTLSGGVAYDNIKVYPSDANVSIYTYKPLVGLESASDASEKTWSNNYDTFGRLAALKDNSGHIIKSYDYRFRNTLPTPIYYNSEKKIKIFRNNCVPDALAGYVWYIVPAKKYSAASQIAADALASADLTANAQSYANQAAGCVVLFPITIGTEAIDGTGYISNVKVYKQGSLMLSYDPSVEEKSVVPGTYTFEVKVVGSLYSESYGTGYGAVRMSGDGVDSQCQANANNGVETAYTFTVTLEAGTYINFNIIAGNCQ